MPDKIPVEALASRSAQDLSQKQLAGCILTKQTDHEHLSSRFFILHVFGKLTQSRCLDLIGDIISSVSTTTWYESKIDSMLIGKGGALNKGLRLNEQLIMVFGCILERHIRQ